MCRQAHIYLAKHHKFANKRQILLTKHYSWGCDVPHAPLFEIGLAIYDNLLCDPSNGKVGMDVYLKTYNRKKGR